MSQTFPRASIPSVPDAVYNKMRSDSIEIKTITVQQKFYELGLQKEEKYFIRGMPKPIRAIEERKDKVLETLKFSER